MKLPKIYKDKDAYIGLIKDKCVAIIGYGNQGRAQALNLRDSGIDVRIGLKEESERMVEAEKESFRKVKVLRKVFSKGKAKKSKVLKSQSK